MAKITYKAVHCHCDISAECTDTHFIAGNIMYDDGIYSQEQAEFIATAFNHFQERNLTSESMDNYNNKLYACLMYMRALADAN